MRSNVTVTFRSNRLKHLLIYFILMFKSYQILPQYSMRFKHENKIRLHIRFEVMSNKINILVRQIYTL